eukprot:CAMPEP_0116128026 /NCGR_PEP_ID=MMETSP0329-20121206/7143_1 /TAXON_ID=697910 /ORGANISM="Pseudo-nitzschia arenysensis, Strain B593" /LENGTH=202 /DNA_ID=CAMNT_0003622143 /DNA_START=63 /DNA_END=671 /DNA_ORIENTATION=-
MTNETGATGGSKGNILTRSKPFQKLVDKVFKACDTSKTGSISKSELYVGLLSVHITLARYAGPAACFPPSREVSDQLFEAADADKSGGISKPEFQKILAILSAQILSRMLVYYFVLILYVPWFSNKVVDSIESIPEGGLIHSIAEQVISVAIFMGAVPLLWNAIDSKTETTIDKMNSTATAAAAATSIINPERKSEGEKKDN